MWKCKTCSKEGEEHFYKSQGWYCKECWNVRTAKRGKDNVKIVKQEYGGKCSCCGYDKCMDALEFHHVDPKQKEFALSNGRGYNLDKLRKELDKCILVCRNCHTEIHYDMKTKVLQHKV